MQTHINHTQTVLQISQSRFQTHFFNQSCPPGPVTSNLHFNKNTDWGVFPRILALTVTAARNRLSTLQQWAVMRLEHRQSTHSTHTVFINVQSHTHTQTHTHTRREMHNLFEVEAAAALTEGFLSLPPGKWLTDSTTWPSEWRWACCSTQPIRLTSCLLTLSHSPTHMHAQTQRHQHIVRVIGINI